MRERGDPITDYSANYSSNPLGLKDSWLKTRKAICNLIQKKLRAVKEGERSEGNQEMAIGRSLGRIGIGLKEMRDDLQRDCKVSDLPVIERNRPSKNKGDPPDRSREENMQDMVCPLKEMEVYQSVPKTQIEIVEGEGRDVSLKGTTMACQTLQNPTTQTFSHQCEWRTRARGRTRLRCTSMRRLTRAIAARVAIAGCCMGARQGTMDGRPWKGKM